MAKALTILMILLIVGSLFSALLQLARKKDGAADASVVKALTFRVGLSVCLFALLMAGFRFGIISPQGLR